MVGVKPSFLFNSANLMLLSVTQMFADEKGPEFISKLYWRVKALLSLIYSIVVDPHCFYADPDPGSQTYADPSGSGSCSDFAVTKRCIFT